MHCTTHFAHAPTLQVFNAFKEMSSISGDKSQDRKKNLIVKLLAGAKDEEAGYVMRALQVSRVAVYAALWGEGRAALWLSAARWQACCLSTSPEPCLLFGCLPTSCCCTAGQAADRAGRADGAGGAGARYYAAEGGSQRQQ
jgi:hypothetical protein